MSPLLLHGALLAVLALQVASPSPTQTPPAAEPAVSLSATPSPGSLRLAIDKAVDEALEKGMLRFEDNVEVEGRTPQEALEAFLRGFDLECGAPQRGAPTDAETRAQMRAQRPSTPYQVDFVPLLTKLQEKMSKRGPARYYIYRILKDDGLSYRLRDSPMPMSQIYNTPAARFELVAQAQDLKGATEAFWRLERGLPPARSGDDSRPSPWLDWNCRPR